jgi:hypothetical protein
MKINQPFNKLTFKEYHFYIDNHKKYSDFNTLGLYRSIIENEKLTLEEKIQVRDYANAEFQKTFDFLQLKDPMTYMAVVSLGIEMTKADERQLWLNVQANQLKILKDKDIKHRNFGTYSKHLCGHEWCPYEGLMTQKGSYFAYHNEMYFDTDHSNHNAKDKSKKIVKDRKNEDKIIKKELED